MSSAGAAGLGIPERDGLVQEARTLATELGDIRLTDIAPPDLEAEQHAREHLESAAQDEVGDVPLPEELQDKRNMESLEDMMNRMGAGQASVEKRGRPTVEDLEKIEARLLLLAQLMGMSLPLR